MLKNTFLALLLLGCSPVVWAQVKTPVAKSWVSNSSSRASASAAVRNNPTHLFNIQLKKVLWKIRKDVRAGKLTQTQAQTQKDQLKNIRVQELQFFKGNGNDQLTADQAAQLNQALTALSASL